LIQSCSDFFDVFLVSILVSFPSPLSSPAVFLFSPSFLPIVTLRSQSIHFHLPPPPLLIANTRDLCKGRADKLLPPPSLPIRHLLNRLLPQQLVTFRFALAPSPLSLSLPSEPRASDFILSTSGLIRQAPPSPVPTGPTSSLVSHKARRYIPSSLPIKPPPPCFVLRRPWAQPSYKSVISCT
jgi:hypothetical protein